MIQETTKQKASTNLDFSEISDIVVGGKMVRSGPNNIMNFQRILFSDVIKEYIATEDTYQSIYEKLDALSKNEPQAIPTPQKECLKPIVTMFNSNQYAHKQILGKMAELICEHYL